MRQRRRNTRRRLIGGQGMNVEAENHPQTRAWTAAHPDPTMMQKGMSMAYKHAPSAGLLAASFAAPLPTAVATLVCGAAFRGYATVGDVLGVFAANGPTELKIASVLANGLGPAAATAKWYDNQVQAWARTQDPEIQRKLARVAKELDITPEMQSKCLPSHPFR